MSADPEVSIVMPCLNEADTLAACIEKARASLEQHGLAGEIIVADNGSTDGSPAIAARCGARVVPVEARGYGCALMGGLAAARGRYLVMADADDSYDFADAHRFVGKLREGYDLVQGCRMPAGGGRILPGAMPPTHRWIGNPLFSYLTRRWFHAPIHDVYCGMRGFTRAWYQRLRLRCTGMEFATEMIIDSAFMGARMAEVPIVLHPDGRQAHAPHLKTLRDGWRTLRFFLMYSPRWLFLMPGLLLIALGALGYLAALPGLAIGGAVLDAHTLLVASMLIICGYQSLLFSLFTKTFAVREGWLPDDRRLGRFFTLFNLEKGLLLGGASLVLGVALLLVAINWWRLQHFGPLEYSRTMKWVVPGVMLAVLGFQTILSSFFVSIIGMPRK